MTREQAIDAAVRKCMLPAIRRNIDNPYFMYDLACAYCKSIRAEFRRLMGVA